MTLGKTGFLTLAGGRLRLAAVGLIWVLAVAPPVAQAQTGSVEGHVICSDGNVPARSAEVELVPPASLLPRKAGTSTAAQQTMDSRTDLDGVYVFPSVPAGSYIVYAKEAGYSDDFGLVRAVLSRFTLDERKKLLANFPQVKVNAGDTAREDVFIQRGGAIMGRVSVDLGGTPGRTVVTATMVSSDLLGDVSGSRGEKPLDFALTGMTDDRGVYRIAGLPAGTYRVQVRLREAYYQAVGLVAGHFEARPTRTGTGGLTVFAPDALTEEDAKLVKIGDGDELSDVDITIPMRLLHSIGGTVTRGGAPVAGADLIIFRNGKSVGASDAASTSNGSYRFDLLPAGTYTIEVKYPVTDTYPSPPPDTHPVIQKITIQLTDDDILDANIDLPNAAPAK